jgi:cytochrome c oxidase subunit 2
VKLLLRGAAPFAFIARPAGASDSTVTTPSIFDPSSTPAQGIVDYSSLVLGICAVIFVLVTLLLTYTVIRYRQRPDDDDREPPQIYGSNQLELAWTVIPVIIVFVLSMVTVRTIFALQVDERPAGWMPVTAVGHQWWWAFEYPEFGFTTANELHVPVDRATFLNLQSADVVHSFWVPQLSGKTDVIPNRENHMWVEPQRTGLFVGQCAEYCGTQHANMLLRVYVETPDQFARWAAAEARDAVAAPGVEKGREVFLTTACINCHTVRGTVANGRFGPDLTHLMSRDTLASGVVPNDAANLKAWIADPDHLKPGALMPAMGLEDLDLDALVAYLLSLE